MVHRGDITGGNIFAAAAGKSSASKDSKDSSKSDKKLHALKTIGKATKSKQSELLNKKGFGLIISKVKEKNRQTPLNLQMVMPMESKSLRRRRKV